MTPTRFPRRLVQALCLRSSINGEESQGFVDRRRRPAKRGRRLCPLGEGLEQRLVLSTFQVNSLLDTVAVNLKSGKDSSGHITLRSAIMAADAKGGSNTIKLPSGTITLTIAGADEDASATGDLDIKGNLTIKGKGAGTTIVDGNNLDRVFQVLSGKVTISNLTIQHGRVVADGGGGLLNSGGGVALSSVQILNNTSIGLAGGDGINGGSGLAGGAGGLGTAGEGGGIFNAAGSLKIANSTIASNRAFGGVGGSGGSGGFAGGNNGGSGANGQTGRGGNGGAGGAGGDGLGGGVFNAAGASLSLSGVTFAADRSVGGIGGVGGSGNIGAGGAGGPKVVAPGVGGDGFGGAGGVGGQGGRGAGGGVFNLGTVSVSGNASTFSSNTAFGGTGTSGGSGANGVGGAGAAGGLAGGDGGGGFGGIGGVGGRGGDGVGGGVFNGGGAVLTSTAAPLVCIEHRIRQPRGQRQHGRIRDWRPGWRRRTRAEH